ncbi:MAG: hypothetical protein ACE369_06430 [Roseovarius sp.]
MRKPLIRGMCGIDPIAWSSRPAMAVRGGKTVCFAQGKRADGVAPRTGNDVMHDRQAHLPELRPEAFVSAIRRAQ